MVVWADLSTLKGASLVVQRLKHLPAMWETWVQSLGWEDPLEKEMATHSSLLAWRIPWMEEPGGQQSMGSQRVGHDWATSLYFFISCTLRFMILDLHMQYNDCVFLGVFQMCNKWQLTGSRGTSILWTMSVTGSLCVITTGLFVSPWLTWNFTIRRQ